MLYGQERTAVFGETFPVFKFRLMTPEGESTTPIEDDDNDRITRGGGFFSQTHLGEIPQRWSILRGDMSVVGRGRSGLPKSTCSKRRPICGENGGSSSQG